MSLSIVSAALVSQLCYFPAHDLGDGYWLKKANLLEPELMAAVKSQSDTCIELTKQSELDEAAYLVKLDPTKKTIVLSKK